MKSLRSKARTQRTLKICVVLTMFGFLPGVLTAQDDARIRELQDRVSRLEGLVKTLVEAQRSAGTLSNEGAKLILADLRTPVASAVTNSLDPEPSSPQPTPASGRALPQELLPNLGKIGATASFRAGMNSGPFALNRGGVFGGAIELPLALLPGGRLNYEISLGLAQANRTLPLTSNVAQISNLAVLTALNPNNGTTNIQQALSGTGDSPFPVTSDAKWRVQLLELVPFALKYNNTMLDRYRLRPYAVLGVGAYVSISNQLVAAGIRSDSTLNQQTLQTLGSLLGPSPFGGGLIGGQIGAANQLSSRGVPAGQGGLDLGLHFGTGLEYRWTNTLSVAIDARFNKVPDGLSYHTTTVSWGWHF
jgi:hypothetical protein